MFDKYLYLTNTSKQNRDHFKDYALDLILWLDNREIKESQRRMKAEYDKIKKN